MPTLQTEIMSVHIPMKVHADKKIYIHDVMVTSSGHVHPTRADDHLLPSDARDTRNVQVSPS